MKGFQNRMGHQLPIKNHPPRLNKAEDEVDSSSAYNIMEATITTATMIFSLLHLVFQIGSLKRLMKKRNTLPGDTTQTLCLSLSATGSPPAGYAEPTNQGCDRTCSAHAVAKVLFYLLHLEVILMLSSFNYIGHS